MGGGKLKAKPRQDEGDRFLGESKGDAATAATGL